MRHTTRTVSVLAAALLWALPAANGGVSEHVSMVAMSKEWDYGSPGEVVTHPHQFDISVEADGSVTGITCQVPDGGPALVLQPDDTGDPWWSWGGEYATEAELDVYPHGEYVFTIYYSTQDPDVTAVRYEAPGGGAIPQVTQEPVVLSPSHLGRQVPTTVTVEWEPCTDPAATSIGLEWEPDDGLGPSGEVSLPLSQTQYRLVGLADNTTYDLQLTFDQAYRDTNADGIDYVVDTDAQLKVAFTTPEPAIGSLLGIGTLTMLSRRHRARVRRQ